MFVGSGVRVAVGGTTVMVGFSNVSVVVGLGMSWDKALWVAVRADATCVEIRSVLFCLFPKGKLHAIVRMRIKPRREILFFI